LLNAFTAVRYRGKESVRCRPHTEGKAEEALGGKVKPMPPNIFYLRLYFIRQYSISQCSFSYFLKKRNKMLIFVIAF